MDPRSEAIPTERIGEVVVEGVIGISIPLNGPGHGGPIFDIMLASGAK